MGALKLSVRCFCAAIFSDAKIAICLVFRRAGLARCGHDLVQKPAPPMPPITDSLWNSAQPNFQRGTRRVWKKNGYIEAWPAAKKTDGRDKRLVRQRHDFIHLLHQFPHWREVCRC